MMRRLLWNDIRSHKLLSLSMVVFMAASSLLISLAAVLFAGLLGSVDGLMEKSLGAYGFNFVIRWEHVILIVLVLMSAAAAAAASGTMEVKKNQSI